jgi:exonuclease SbcC
MQYNIVALEKERRLVDINGGMKMKFAEIPDFHLDPKWIDISIGISKIIEKVIIDNDIGFMVLPGDFFNRPLIATDKGGINTARSIIKLWSKHCPIAAIEGTPTHDGKGGYGPLEDCGLILLRPNKVYGYSESLKNIEVMNNDNKVDCILVGVPELNKSALLSQLSLPAEQANAEIEKAFENYITNFIAPMRAKYKDIPAIGLLHGNVSDSTRENTEDVILRASDILIRTEVLELAGLTRWSLGHIHQPWESKKISAGYAGFTGIDDSPWGKTGFVPAMNLVEIKDKLIGDNTETGPVEIEYISKISRIPYGTPERRKIFAPLASYDPNIAYWLHSKDRAAVITGGHEWSRVTTEPEKKETQRAIITTDNLAELFKAIDPKVSQSVISRVESLQLEHSAPHLSVQASVDFITISGCSFWHGRSVTLAINKLPTGLTAIMGDNGAGKSSLLAFCSPYPVVIGKDTKSGRASAIKDFFIEPDSSIEKILTVNGEQHRHLINIKGAHTQTPKVECYLYIGTANQLDTTSWDDMFAKCEELYGSFADYLLTTFYVQPLQGKSGSSLMSAGMTDIRNLVQSIAGVDRETEKRHALDMLSKFEKELSDNTAWIKGAEEFAVDIDKLESDKLIAQAVCMEAEKAILLTVERGKTAHANQIAIAAQKTASDAEAKQKTRDEDRASEIADTVFTLQNNITDLNELVSQLSAMRENMATIEKRDKIVADNAALKNKYDAEVNAYNRELGSEQEKARKANSEKQTEYDKKKREYDSNVSKMERERDNQKAIIDRLKKPCPNCGWISNDAINEMEDADDKIKTFDDLLAKVLPPQNITPSPIPSKLDRAIPVVPKYVVFNSSGPMLSKSKLQSDIERAVSAEATIKAKESEIEKLNQESDRLTAKEYNIIAGIAEQLESAESAYNALLKQHREETAKIAAFKESIKNLETQIKEATDKKEEIAKHKAMIPVLESEIIDWKYIASMLQANKIPALELESVIGTIDAEATRILEPFLDGVLCVTTETQQEGKKGTIDKFDIIVHNNATGQEQSFITFSPGVKAFISDAYVKALVMVRNNRAHRHYSPIISDEADGPIQPERVAAYYEMQSAYYAGSADRVLVVSHAPDAHNYVQSHVRVEDLLKEEE